MARRKSKVNVSDEDFIEAWRRGGSSPSATAELLGMSIRGVYQRRNVLVGKGHNLPTVGQDGVNKRVEAVRHTHTFEKRRAYRVRNGRVIVFSDAHYWPGDPSLAHIALTRLVAELMPALVIANGDLLDGARISRHEPRGWSAVPTLRQELDVLVERFGELDALLPPDVPRARTLGNHDIRMERWLAMRVPEVEDLPGTRLEDYLPGWPCSWSVQVNDDTIVKHRWKGGIHATYRNAVESGWNIVTGHLHRMRVTPFTDYRGTRFGVDSGCLADTDHDCFDYAEDNPTDWRSGFVVLTYRDGVLLWPEFCYIHDRRAWFRGEAIA